MFIKDIKQAINESLDFIYDKTGIRINKPFNSKTRKADLQRISNIVDFRKNAVIYGDIKKKGKFNEDLNKGIKSFYKNKNEKKKKRDMLNKSIVYNTRERKINKYLINGQYQEILNLVVNDQYILSKKQATEIVNSLLNKGVYLIKINKGLNSIHDQDIVINEANKDYFIDMFSSGLANFSNDKYNNNADGSDKMYEFNYDGIDSMDLIEISKPERTLNKDGGFFNYNNKSKLNLKRYQIFKEDYIYDDSQEHCLINTLSLSGVDLLDIKTLMIHFKEGYNTRKKDLPMMSNILKRNIILYEIDEDGKETKKTIKADLNIEEKEILKGEDIHIALFENHYFIYEQTEYSTFFINNYDMLKDIENGKNIFKRRTINISENKTKIKYEYLKDSDESKRASSLGLINKLFIKNYFQKLNIANLVESNMLRENKNHYNLGNIENEQNGGPSGPIDECKNISYADCESFVYSGNHDLYAIGAYRDDIKIEEEKQEEKEEVKIFNVCDRENKYVKAISKKGKQYNKDNRKVAVDKFLDYITNGATIKHSVCYFHNLKYDLYLLMDHIFLTNTCEKDGNIYSATIMYRGCKILLKDSYKMIPFALGKFAKEFNLDKKYHKKEAIYYEYYKPELHNKRIKTKEYKNLLSVDDRVVFTTEVVNDVSYNENDETFNPTTYYMDYLKNDVLCLKNGVEKFNEIILNITNGSLNIHNYLTISSLTDMYMRKQDCYTGINYLDRNIKAYVNMAVYGGRVHVNDKFVKQVIKKRIADFDGVSLYPSAIVRLCREMGFPLGKAKNLTNDQLSRYFNNNKISKDYYNECNYGVFTINITKVGKHQQMPFIAIKSEDGGSIKYTNEIGGIYGNQKVIIDIITLEDYIKFHDINFEVLEGVYWNEGYNQKMGDVVKKLFDKRVSYKKDSPAIANVLKLMLNSSYGKTILKTSKTTKKVVLNNNLDKYIYNNFRTITKIRKLNYSASEVETINIEDKGNRAHIGCMILSMSKRIMNEVMDTANDLNINVYYTDTDSMHLDMDRIKELENEYFNRYGKVLNGKGLEQFHEDFNLEGHDDSKGVLHSIKFIGLGKKSYYDKLKGVDKDGNVIYGSHIRLKGITEAGLLHESKKYKAGYYGLFRHLATGAAVEFTLNPYNEKENKNKVLFQFTKGKGVSTKTEFKRIVEFIDKDEKEARTKERTTLKRKRNMDDGQDDQESPPEQF